VAVITGVVLAALALLFLAIARPLFAILASAVVLVAQAELYHTMRRRGYQPATALGLVLGGLTLAAAYLRGEQGMLFVLALGLILTFLWYMVAPPKARAGSLGNIGATMLGLAYVPFLAGYILVILSQANSGRSLMLSVIALTFLYDVVAFFIGSFYGSRPLAPTISPKKSWEGLAAATVVTFGVSIAFVSQIGPMTGPRAAGLALVVCILAPLGDLAESALKRDLGVKDMGTIMPGHGGALDRIDSALFVAPAAFYFLRLIL
jgi:phosphatidate cytidylyltransferase